ncbi:MAG: VWA domain-containing protein [Desulfuromonadales bacterium]
MIELAYPWLLTLALLPVFIYWLLPVYKERRDAVMVPFFSRLILDSGKQPDRGAVKLRRNRLQQVLLAFGWICLVIAMARPEWVGEPIEQTKSSRDIMVALDLSGSMSEKDFTDLDGIEVDRLTAAKQVLAEFASRRENDRLGLILFGDAAYLQAPFTSDLDTWLQLLDETELGIAGWQTAIGDAIGLSVTAFESGSTENRLLVLLTDGYDTGSAMPPIKAAEIARQHAIRIYTIAMGDPSVNSKYQLDAETLEAIAASTGGASFQAIDSDQLAVAYGQIDEMERDLHETVEFRPRTSLHHYPVAVYVLLNIMLLLPSLLRAFTRGRRPTPANDPARQEGY